MRSAGFVNVLELLARVTDRRARARPAIAADQEHLVGLERVEVGGVGRIRPDAADVDERHGDVDAAGGHGQVPVPGLEPELEGEVFARIAVVVHVDFVDRVGIHREEVGPAVDVLQRDVVGDQGHESFASRLVAPECVEVGAVHLGPAGDAGRLAMAGPERRDAGGGDERRTGQQLNRSSFHCVLQKGAQAVSCLARRLCYGRFV